MLVAHERTRHQKSLVAPQNLLLLPKQWGCGRVASAGQPQGPAAAPGFASFPLQERWRRLCSTPKLHLGEEVRKKQSQRVRQPSGIPLHGFGILPRSPAAFCPRAGPQQPPGLSPPARPDNGRVLGGFGRFTSYKMFVSRIYPVARR